MAERKSSTSKKTGKAKTSSPPVSTEYREYEKRHTNLGQDRPKLTPAEFDEYEDELLDLLALKDAAMTDDQIVRVQELEYLLIDSD